MPRHETDRDDLSSAMIRVFNRLRYGLSAVETARADHKAN